METVHRLYSFCFKHQSNYLWQEITFLYQTLVSRSIELPYNEVFCEVLQTCTRLETAACPRKKNNTAKLSSKKHVIPTTQRRYSRPDGISESNRNAYRTAQSVLFLNLDSIYSVFGESFLYDKSTSVYFFTKMLDHLNNSE